MASVVMILAEAPEVRSKEVPPRHGWGVLI